MTILPLEILFVKLFVKILSIKVAEDPYNRVGLSIDLVTVFDAILTSRQTCEKLQCLYENLMSNNFPKTGLCKISV